MKFFKNYFHIKKCSSHQFRASKLCPRCINALNLSKNPPLRIFVLHFISLIRFEKNFNCFLIAVIVIVGVALDQVEINEDIYFFGNYFSLFLRYHRSAIMNWVMMIIVGGVRRERERLKIAFACARLSDRHSRNFSPHHIFFYLFSFLGHLETPSHKWQERNLRIRLEGMRRVQAKVYKNSSRENQAIERERCRLEKLEIIDFVCLMSVIFGLGFSRLLLGTSVKNY